MWQPYINSLLCPIYTMIGLGLARPRRCVSEHTVLPNTVFLLRLDHCVHSRVQTLHTLLGVPSELKHQTGWQCLSPQLGSQSRVVQCVLCWTWWGNDTFLLDAQVNKAPLVLYLHLIVLIPNGTHVLCYFLSFSSHRSDKMTDKKHLKEWPISFDSQFEGVIHCGREGCGRSVN